MALSLRTQASARLTQSFSSTSPKVIPSLGATVITRRNLSISGHKEASPVLNSFESTVASIPKRSDIIPNARTYNTSRTSKQVNDSSTVDFTYIPAISFTHAVVNQQYARMPLLPDNYLVKHQDTSPEPHTSKAEISTAVMNDDVALSMSESDANKSSDNIGLKEMLPEAGPIKQVWNDFLDDIMGLKKKAVIA